MLRLIASLVAVILLGSPPIVYTSSNHVKLLQETVRPLQRLVTSPHDPASPMFETFCTAFSISKQHRGWMTVAHCIPPPEAGIALYIDGHAAHVVRVDTNIDLAILQTPSWQPVNELKFAKNAPRIADTLEVLGYGWGKTVPFYFVASVTMVEVDFFRSHTVITTVAMGGISGSPAVDRSGRVVGVAHTRLGGSEASDVSPLMGITAFSILQAFDKTFIPYRTLP